MDLGFHVKHGRVRWHVDCDGPAVDIFTKRGTGKAGWWWFKVVKRSVLKGASLGEGGVYGTKHGNMNKMRKNDAPEAVCVCLCLE